MRRTVTASFRLLMALTGLACSLAAPAQPKPTRTPVEHLVVVIGENISFDALFATYQPPAGQTVRNLLSRGIVTSEGTPGAAYAQALQRQVVVQDRFGVDHPQTTPYTTLPRAYARTEPGAPKRLDEKMPANLPPGPYQITRLRPYTEYTDSNPVHRFFQMWQQVNAGRHDLFVWTGQTSGEGARDRTRDPAKGTYYGSESMGFYNMASGDAPYFKALASQFAISDNYHQAVMGGTMPNYIFIASGDVARYTHDGQAGTPPESLVENPEPVSGTLNWYTQSGYASGSYVACADEQQPGVGAIRRYMRTLPYQPFRDGNCAAASHYLVNNLPQPYTFKGVKKPVPANLLMATPQSHPSIVTQLEAANISWKWYHGGRSANTLKKGEYSGDTDPLTFFTSVMESSLVRKLQSDEEFMADADRMQLPAISFISPPLSKTGHPHHGSPAHFEAYVKTIVDKIQGHEKLWDKTAILVTFDEGGGYFDSGYIQPVDFFGDGTRVPLLLISKWAKKGHVEHSYYDHASIHKFIQRNWSLKPISERTRDNLPNPVHTQDAYIPNNRPAIGDLFEMFSF